MELDRFPLPHTGAVEAVNTQRRLWEVEAGGRLPSVGTRLLSGESPSSPGSEILDLEMKEHSPKMQQVTQRISSQSSLFSGQMPRKGGVRQDGWLQTVSPSTSQALQENPAPSLPPSPQWLPSPPPPAGVRGPGEDQAPHLPGWPEARGTGAYTWPTIMRIWVGGDSQIEHSNKTQNLVTEEPKESVS